MSWDIYGNPLRLGHREVHPHVHEEAMTAQAAQIEELIQEGHGPEGGGMSKPTHPLDGFDPHTLVIAATRYYMGRRTIHATHFAQFELAKNWWQLPEGTRLVIQRDLEMEFERDDEARTRGDLFLPLGEDCDRAAWECVRRAWESEPCA